MLTLDEYGHYDEYMMSTYDTPNFLMPLDGISSSHHHNLDNKPTTSNAPVEAAKKQKLSQLTKLPLPSAAPAAVPHDVANDQMLLTIILPNSFYSGRGNQVSHGQDDNNEATGKKSNSGSNKHHDDTVIDYDAELPKPMKSATVFDYHEVSIEDYDWDRIFGEAASLQATH